LNAFLVNQQYVSDKTKPTTHHYLILHGQQHQSSTINHSSADAMLFLGQCTFTPRARSLLSGCGATM